MLYPQNIESKILFDKVKELVSEKCLSNLGKLLVEDISFSSNFEFIKNEITKVDEFKIILFKYDDFPTTNFIDARKIVGKTSIIGAFIDLDELLVLKNSLDTIKNIIRFFNNHKEEFPQIFGIVKNVNLHKFVIDKINAIITSNGRIKDNASDSLQDIRKSLNYKQISISKIVNAVLQKIKSEGWIETDLSATHVNGRITVPIESTYKRKIKGLVHDVSATGKTTYIEPEEVINLNNEIVELENQERKEIYRILLQFTQDIEPYKDDLINSYNFLAEIDFIRAKAIFAKNTDSIKPGLVSKPEIILDKAKHPILDIKLRKENKKIVPLSLEINEKQRIILISGPNAGGKSVTLKTVALLQYMLQCGFLVPVGGSTEMGVFSNIFIDIGDEQSVENDLSTYSSHLINMKYFLKNANQNTLFFIDEFGTGTEPMLGGAIAEAVLTELNEKQPKGIITTHYTNLKHFAVSANGVENAAMLFDTEKIQPVYILDVGKPGSSFAFETARKIGIPENILKNAEEKTGKNHIDFDKHLRQVLRDKKYWEEKRNKIKQDDRKLEEIVQKYELELQNIKKLKTDIIQKAKDEAKEIVNKANRTIENTVKEIKSAQANTEKTKKIRQNFENEKNEILQNVIQNDNIDQKLKQIEKDGIILQKENNKIVNLNELEIRISDKVRYTETNNIGEVIEINNKNAVVAFGNLLTSISIKKLEKISNNEFKKLTSSTRKESNISNLTLNKKVNFNSHIDIRGERVEAALEKITHFVDDAVMFGFTDLKILHGTGTGALRNAIRNYLKTMNIVASIKDESVEFGGAGITLVKLDY